MLSNERMLFCLIHDIGEVSEDGFKIIKTIDDRLITYTVVFHKSSFNVSKMIDYKFHPDTTPYGYSTGRTGMGRWMPIEDALNIIKHIKYII